MYHYRDANYYCNGNHYNIQSYQINMLNTLNLHNHTVLHVTYISIGKNVLKSQEHSSPVQSATSEILISPSVKWVSWLRQA